MLTNVYGPTQNDLKSSFLTKLRMLACLHDIPWIILGDFNIVHDPGDSNSTNPNLHYMLPFNDLINDPELT
jgi:exonuclease III